MDNEKCPCEDCITLPICRIVIYEFKFIIHLKVKCPLLREYLKIGSMPYEDLMIRYDKTWKILGKGKGINEYSRI